MALVETIMDPGIQEALDAGGRVDITTFGRRSGEERRTKIYLHNIDGVLWITGRPEWPRDWVANLRANPAMTVHLRRGVTADLSARGTVFTDPEEKADVILRARIESWGENPEEVRSDNDEWARKSPLVKVEIRVFGQDRGTFPVPDDFDDPLPEEVLGESENA